MWLISLSLTLLTAGVLESVVCYCCTVQCPLTKDLAFLAVLAMPHILFINFLACLTLSIKEKCPTLVLMSLYYLMAELYSSNESVFFLRLPDQCKLGFIFYYPLPYHKGLYEMLKIEMKLHWYCKLVKVNLKPIYFSFAAATTTLTHDADALASRIEVLVASIRWRSQRLYKDTDGNKGRARIRRKIREKGILTSVEEKYNRMVPSTETVCLETILSGETVWPWQLPDSGMYTNLLTTFNKSDT